MTKKQAVKLSRLISKNTNAQIDRAFKGAMPPENWDAIEKNANMAKKELFDYIRSLCKDQP